MMRPGAPSLVRVLVFIRYLAVAFALENHIFGQGYESYFATTITTQTVFAACGIPEPTTTWALCTTSTNLVLPDNAVLSGVTVHPASSPTSCYSLPVPISSLDMVAYHTNDEEFSDSESGTSGSHDPLFFYMGDNATSPQYISATINGSRALLDLSSEAASCGHIAIALPRGQSLVFDNDGMHLYHDGCESVSSVSIANFTEQLTSIGKLPTNPSCRRGIVKRQVPEVNFTVEVTMNTSVDANVPQPDMMFGQSPCERITRITGTDADICSWTCQVPGEFSGVKQCEKGFRSWMNGTSGSAIPSPKNVSNLIDYITPFLETTGGSIGRVFPALTPVLDQVVPFIGRAHQAIADTVNFGGLAMCKFLHQNDEYDLVMHAIGMAGEYTVGAFVSPPAPTISGNLVRPTASPTKEPPRIGQPGQSGFPIMSALSFSPLPLLPTLGIPGLTGRDTAEATSTAKFLSDATLLVVPPL